MADKLTVAKVVNYLAAAYPNFVLPDETTQVYAESLSGMSNERLVAAARSCVGYCKFFPTVAELHEAGLRVRIESQYMALTPGVVPHLTPPDPRICPKCKGMRYLYMPKQYRPEWDALVKCSECNVDMNEPEPQPQRERSWRR